MFSTANTKVKRHGQSANTYERERESTMYVDMDKDMEMGNHFIGHIYIFIFQNNSQDEQQEPGI